MGRQWAWKRSYNPQVSEFYGCFWELQHNRRGFPKETLLLQSQQAWVPSSWHDSVLKAETPVRVLESRINTVCDNRSHAGTKEAGNLSYLDYVLEALVSETNFSIYKLILEGGPAEFLDGKSEKGLGKKTSQLNKSYIKKLAFPYWTTLGNLRLTKESKIWNGLGSLWLECQSDSFYQQIGWFKWLNR